MPEPTVQPVTTSTTSASDNPDAMVEYLVLSNLFQQILKKPESDDDAEQSTTAANEINKTIAAEMAKGITGFGV